MPNLNGVHKTNIVFSVLKIILAAVLVVLCAAYMNVVIGETQSLDSKVIEGLVKFFRGMGIIAGVTIIVIEFLGIISFIIKSKSLNIFFIIWVVLLSIALIAIGIYATLPAAATAAHCSNVTRNCYMCPFTNYATCEAERIDSGKSCFTYKVSFDLICNQTMPKLEAGLIIIFAVALLQFVASILGFCGCRRLRRSYYHEI